MNYQYGGQAVIEGVMMRGPSTRAVAVRRPDHSIVVDEKPVGSLTKRVPVLKYPLLRGVVMLIESLTLGMEALTFSANQATGEEESLSIKEIVVTIGVALGLAILLFVVLPAASAQILLTVATGTYMQDGPISGTGAVTRIFQTAAPGGVMRSLIEGFVRIALFILYIVAIARLQDIKRVFAYHGAEHKVINAYEAGDELTVAAVQRHSTLHPRCGTSFLLIVMVISILLFSLLGKQVLWWRILSKILLLPLVAGISYELIKLSGKYYSKAVCRYLIAPGLWLQKLTTREPDDSQVEVALRAFGTVLKEGEKCA